MPGAWESERNEVRFQTPVGSLVAVAATQRKESVPVVDSIVSPPMTKRLLASS